MAINPKIISQNFFGSEKYSDIKPNISTTARNLKIPSTGSSLFLRYL
jgi:hypothetical protein